MIYRVIITIITFCFFSWLLCEIDIEKTYSWYSGIWQGYFFTPNYILNHFRAEWAYKAEHYTMAYNVFYQIFRVVSVIHFVVAALGIDKAIYHNRHRY